MRTLIAYEFMKLLGRRAAWGALLLALAAFALLSWQAVRGSDLPAQAQGMRDVYSRYEGQAVTDALRLQAQKDYEAHLASNADRFDASTVTVPNGREYTWYIANQPGYDEGVRLAFEDIGNLMTLEDKEQRVRQAQERLDAGAEEDGKPLTDAARSGYESTVRLGARVSHVHYAQLWQRSLQLGSVLPGILTLLVLAAALLALFNGEAAARLEAVVLTAKARQQTAWAKMWTALIVSIGVSVLFFGLQFALDTLIWGLDGAQLPVSDYYYGMNLRNGIDLPVGRAFALGQGVVLLASVCCGCVLAWASARWRWPLMALLAAGLALGSMIALHRLFANNFWHFEEYAASHDLQELSATISSVLERLWTLPPNVLIESYPLPFQMTQAAKVIPHLALLLALTALLWWRSLHNFLRHRKV